VRVGTLLLGIFVGDDVGTVVLGAADGKKLGNSVLGESDGDLVGSLDGASVGNKVGVCVGL